MSYEIVFRVVLWCVFCHVRMCERVPGVHRKSRKSQSKLHVCTSLFYGWMCSGDGGLVGGGGGRGAWVSFQCLWALISLCMNVLPNPRLNRWWNWLSFRVWIGSLFVCLFVCLFVLVALWHTVTNRAEVRKGLYGKLVLEWPWLCLRPFRTMTVSTLYNLSCFLFPVLFLF